MKSNDSSHQTSLSRLSLSGLIVTVGIVFGDIGTSPLYVMKAIVGAVPDYDADYIIGAISCIIWTLTLQTTVKYVLLALRADNKGEGGILALFSLLKSMRRRWLYVIAAVGAAALIADGVITPAITVTSAVEGLKLVLPDIEVLPVVIVVIVLVFVIQSACTRQDRALFRPVHAGLVFDVRCFRCDEFRRMSGGGQGFQSVVCGQASDEFAFMVYDNGRCVFMHDRCRSLVL